MKVAQRNSDVQIIMDGFAIAFVILFLLGFITAIIGVINYFESLYIPL